MSIQWICWKADYIRFLWIAPVEGVTGTDVAENGTLTERVCRTAISEELAPPRAILKDSQNVFRRFNRTVSTGPAVQLIAIIPGSLRC